MNNLKGYAIASDGNMKRIAITYDVIDDETGKPIGLNKKANQFITDDAILKLIAKIDNYAQGIIENQ